MANLSKMKRREELEGYLWVSPWFIGFLAFTFLPFLASFALGFTDWNGVGTPKFVGFSNYVQLFTADPLFWQSLKVTLIFAVLYLPLSLVLGFGLALLMNQPLPGMRFLRTLYYAPSVLSGVAVAVLWGFIFNQNFGVMNWLLHFCRRQARPVAREQLLGNPRLRHNAALGSRRQHAHLPGRASKGCPLNCTTPPWSTGPVGEAGCGISPCR